jgi:hypothetical protein
MQTHPFSIFEANSVKRRSLFFKGRKNLIYLRVFFRLVGYHIFCIVLYTCSTWHSIIISCWNNDTLEGKIGETRVVRDRAVSLHRLVFDLARIYVRKWSCVVSSNFYIAFVFYAVSDLTPKLLRLTPPVVVSWEMEENSFYSYLLMLEIEVDVKKRRIPDYIQVIAKYKKRAKNTGK